MGVIPFVSVKLNAVSQGAEELIKLVPPTLKVESSTLKVALAVPPAPLQDAWKSVASSWVAVAAAARRKEAFR